MEIIVIDMLVQQRSMRLGKSTYKSGKGLTVGKDSKPSKKFIRNAWMLRDKLGLHLMKVKKKKTKAQSSRASCHSSRSST